MPDTNGLLTTTVLNTRTSALIKKQIKTQKLIKLKIKSLIMIFSNQLLLKNLIS